MWSDFDGWSLVSFPSFGDRPLRGVEPEDFAIVCSDMNCDEDNASDMLCRYVLMRLFVNVFRVARKKAGDGRL